MEMAGWREAGEMERFVDNTRRAVYSRRETK